MLALSTNRGWFYSTHVLRTWDTPLKICPGSYEPRLILVAVMMAALCLATIQLDSRPLWIDEAMTFYRSHLPIPEMVEDSVRGRHTPLYFGVMSLWITLGSSAFWMRFFSVLCFVLTVPVVYVIGRILSSRRAGLYAACLVATAPFLIHQPACMPC